MEKYGTSRQATDDNMAQAHCMLDTYDYKHTLRTEYVTLTARPLQQRLHGSVSVLRYTYTVSCFDVFLPDTSFYILHNLIRNLITRVGVCYRIFH